jgi:hypothetical protein
MMGIVGSAVLGMRATLAGAQTVDVQEKPPLYRFGKAESQIQKSRRLDRSID